MMPFRDELNFAPPPDDYLAFMAVRTAPETRDGPLGPVSAAIRARLTTEDMAAVVKALGPGLAEEWEAADEAERVRLLAPAIVLCGAESAAAHARLELALPPTASEGSTRQRATLVADSWRADVLVGALDDIGRQLDRAVIGEVGCGYGGRLRLLAAAAPSAALLGSDTDLPATTWAAESLSCATVLAAPTITDLPFGAESLDVLLSVAPLHAFGAMNGVRVLGEFGRVVRPGGAAVFAYRGWTAMGRDIAGGIISGGRTTALLRGLYRTGHHALDEDTAPRAYMTLEWLVAGLQDMFCVERHYPGRLASGEDVVAVVRR